MNEQEAFKTMTLVQKINKIDKIIDDQIREFLAKDNGDLDIIDVVERNGALIVYIEYEGACADCSSSGTTLKTIETILQRMLADNIRVLSI